MKSIFLFYVAAAAPSAKPVVEMGAWHAISSASPVVQLTLLSLVVLSILCWAIGWAKWREFKSLDQANESFVEKFWEAESLQSLFEQSEKVKVTSSAARVFQSGFFEMQKLVDKMKSSGPEAKLRGVDNLERALRKAVDKEINSMESRLTVLATTGATGPFIGLFGTVWGIMNAFQKIGATGQASLAVVAPGISEALIATAIGLAAAIPAVIMYNHFISRLKRIESDLNHFSSDLLNLSRRSFFQE